MGKKNNYKVYSENDEYNKITEGFLSQDGNFYSDTPIEGYYIVPKPPIGYCYKNFELFNKKEETEKERILNLSLTKREVFLALLKVNITPEMIKSELNSQEDLIELEYATAYYRNNPLVDKIGEKLGYSSADLDYLFLHKELPVK